LLVALFDSESSTSPIVYTSH